MSAGIENMICSISGRVALALSQALGVDRNGASHDEMADGENFLLDVQRQRSCAARSVRGRNITPTASSAVIIMAGRAIADEEIARHDVDTGAVTRHAVSIDGAAMPDRLKRLDAASTTARVGLLRRRQNRRRRRHVPFRARRHRHRSDAPRCGPGGPDRRRHRISYDRSWSCPMLTIRRLRRLALRSAP